MKTYLVVLGLLFLLKNEVSPLTCFMCENQPTNLRCLRFRECSEEEVFCVTAVASYEFASQIWEDLKRRTRGDMITVFPYLRGFHKEEGINLQYCPKHLKKEQEEEQLGIKEKLPNGMMTFKKRITKRCSAFCPDLQMALGFASFGTSCCQRSWCNIWGSLGERNATQGWEWPTIDLTRSFYDGT